MTLDEVLKNLNILHVESDNRVRKSISKTLNIICKNIFEANSAENALTIYSQKKPDIIITDIDLPEMNGIDFVKKIREKNYAIPIILLTYYKDEKFLLEAVKLHLEDYLIKPVSFPKLIDGLEKCTRKIMKNNLFELKFETGYRYNLKSELFSKDNKIVKLTKKEKLLFDILFSNRNNLITYGYIEDVVWEGAQMSKGSLKLLINKIRKKVGKNNIISESEIGYKMTI